MDDVNLELTLFKRNKYQFKGKAVARSKITRPSTHKIIINPVVLSTFAQRYPTSSVPYHQTVVIISRPVDRMLINIFPVVNSKAKETSGAKAVNLIRRL